MKFKRIMRPRSSAPVAVVALTVTLCLCLCHGARADVREDAMRRIEEGVAHYEKGDRKKAYVYGTMSKVEKRKRQKK